MSVQIEASVTCDQCGTGFLCHRADSEESAVDEAQSAGWTESDAGEDLCPKCTAKHNEAGELPDADRQEAEDLERWERMKVLNDLPERERFRRLIRREEAA